MRRTAALIVLIAGLSAATPHLAVAGAPATWQGSIDGVAVWVTVIPREHDIATKTRRHAPWWRWGNVTGDAYLFAIRRPESVRMILDFRRRETGRPEARIYVNDMGRKDVEYFLAGEALNVRSNGGAPYLTMWPDTGGWQVDGKTNYNLRLSIDGAMREVGPARAQTDGQADISIRVGGREPGTPEWQTFRLVNDPHPSWAYLRFAARHRMPGAPPFKAAPALMPSFPYLAMGAARVDWSVVNPSPLHFDVRTSELRLHPFPGFHTAGMYEVHSVTFPPRTDVETPFAFYGFDGSTRDAQLVVRAHSMPAGDRFGPEPTSLERSTFRYSWKTFDAKRWAYSLGLAGSHPYTEQVQVGDERFWSVPADTLPSWVTSRVWPVVTFVEAVQGYPGSEGIYFYSAQADSVWPWLARVRRVPPDFLAAPSLPPSDELTHTSTESLPVGFRGEYDATSSRVPRLYLSPIDNRVHLLHAQGGVWNVGGGRVLRSHNLDGDAYIDGWTRERVPEGAESRPPAAVRGHVDEALHALAGFLIYSGPRGVQVRRTDYRASSLELSPPTDRASWLRFRDRIAPHVSRPRNPEDLESWLIDFPGKALAVSGARVTDVRAVAGGFRFVLDLDPGFQVRANDLVDVVPVKSGRHVVVYDGHLRIETPAGAWRSSLVFGAGLVVAILVLRRARSASLAGARRPWGRR